MKKDTLRCIVVSSTLLLSFAAARADWSRTNGPEGGFINALALNGEKIFAGTDGGVFFSADNGAYWTKVNSGLTNTNVLSLATSGSSVFAGTSGGIFYSVNNGECWDKADSGLTNQGVYALAVSGSAIFAATNGSGVFVSTNSGTSWVEADSGIKDVSIQSFAVSEGNVFAGSNNGVFMTKNGGKNWIAVSDGLLNRDVQCLAVSGSTIFAGPRYNGVWRRPLSEMTGVMSVKHGRGEAKRMKCSISTWRNTESGVTIAFDLPRQDLVNIRIFDIAGREIAIVVNRHLGAGSYRYRWNLRNNATGCYLVNMQVGNRIYSKGIPLSR